MQCQAAVKKGQWYHIIRGFLLGGNVSRRNVVRILCLDDANVVVRSLSELKPCQSKRPRRTAARSSRLLGSTQEFLHCRSASLLFLQSICFCSSHSPPAHFPTMCASTFAPNASSGSCPFTEYRFTALNYVMRTYVVLSVKLTYAYLCFP